MRGVSQPMPSLSFASSRCRSGCRSAKFRYEREATDQTALLGRGTSRSARQTTSRPTPPQLPIEPIPKFRWISTYLVHDERLPSLREVVLRQAEHPLRPVALGRRSPCR